ncbi:hypothetical protein PVIIG_05802 [Plasmodium vivax India VII]|uniref:Variable surface protein Vir4 n=1 Tax=Plasmodium vivax India VII TaxID=1077284 RepID=A0A0J9S2C5_PLAVI|nr:hypothetical protein PVIIG_05802 [Plasmodium vivax India VII]
MVEQEFLGNIISLLGSTPDDLFSEKFYNNLNDDDGLTVYYPDCISLGPVYKDTKSRSLRILCAQLVKYLKTTYILFNKEKLKYNPCILLNYWLYSRLVNILRTEDSSVIALTLGKLELIWNDIVGHASYKSSYNKCVPDSSIVSQNDWRDRQKLYDYCVNYSTVENNIPYYEQTCPEYWSYVESHTSLYRKFEKLCFEEKDKCPKFYNECKQYDPKYVLLKFPCNAEMEQKKADTLAKARQELQAGKPAGQEANSGMLNSSEVSAGGSLLTRDGTHPAKRTGDILLGVVATTLTSGALYRVNIKSLIHIYRIILVKIFLYYMAINNKYVTCILNYCLYKSLHP